MSPLQELADQLRAEDTPISAHVVDPGAGSGLGLPAGLPDGYAPVIEAVREGYLLHYGEPRLLAGHDSDLALLAGDYLYALGIERLAALGDTDAVEVLADLIGGCAQAHTEGHDPDPLWQDAIAALSALCSRGPGST